MTDLRVRERPATILRKEKQVSQSQSLKQRWDAMGSSKTTINFHHSSPSDLVLIPMSEKGFTDNKRLEKEWNGVNTMANFYIGGKFVYYQLH